MADVASNLREAAASGCWSDFFAHAKEVVAPEDVNYSMMDLLYKTSQEYDGSLDSHKQVRIGVLRNFTVDPWLPCLHTELLRKDLVGKIWLGDFDVYEGYVLDPDSAFFRTEFDAVILMFDLRGLVKDRYFSAAADLADTILAKLRLIVSKIIAGTKARVILSNLPYYPYEYDKPYSFQTAAGWPNLLRSINLRIAEEFGSEQRVSIFDLNYLMAEAGIRGSVDLRMYLTTRNPFRLEAIQGFSRVLAKVVALPYRPAKKCVVLDCDNTLWGGILGEDGPAGLKLGEEYPGSAYSEWQHFLLRLHSRGILLALNSKNNEDDVFSYMENTPEMLIKKKHLVSYRVNWNDKAQNLRELAEEINIGIDSMVYVDDSDFECNLIRTYFPAVQVEQFPLNPLEVFDFIDRLENLDFLEVTDTDRERNESYRANVERNRLSKDATDLTDFIRQLQITLTIYKNMKDQAPRVSQMTQRTNQFNLTTKRYTTTDIERFLETSDVYTMRMEDRFGDYGIIGVCIVTREEDPVHAELDTLALSCRAIGRKVENAFLHRILHDLKGSGVEGVTAHHYFTKKNKLVKEYYPDNGFDLVDGTNDHNRFEFPLSRLQADETDKLYTIKFEGF
ncbi:MAG: HAD-IIIC family phosphatase [Candidatus Eisenbacteria bacterium]